MSDPNADPRIELPAKEFDALVEELKIPVKGCATCRSLARVCDDVTCREEAGLLVTCDNCPATSESGWGDTPLCLDCQREDDATKVCEFHQRTFEDDECPLDHDG